MMMGVVGVMGGVVGVMGVMGVMGVLVGGMGRTCVVSGMVVSVVGVIVGSLVVGLLVWRMERRRMLRVVSFVAFGPGSRLRHSALRGCFVVCLRRRYKLFEAFGEFVEPGGMRGVGGGEGWNGGGGGKSFRGW